MSPSKIAIALVAWYACAAHGQQAVVLVRHAELDNAAGLDPRQVPLSAAGAARARRLAALLENSGVTAVYATDFARTQETAAPVATIAGREVTLVSKGSADEFVARLRRDHADDVVLVVGHTDTLPGIIKAFGYAPEVRIDSQDYGNVFVLAPRPGAAPSLVRLRY